MAALREAVGKWEMMVEQALKYDLWGQLVEASELYLQMKCESRDLLNELQGLPADHRHNLSKFTAILEQRLLNVKYHSQKGFPMPGKGAPPPVDEPGITASTMEQLTDIRGHILDNVPWPVQVSSVEVDKDHRTHALMQDEDPDRVITNNRGLLFPAPKMTTGQRILKVDIHSIGLKDAQDYLDPFLTISLRKGPHTSQLVEPEQCTPHPTHKREPSAVTFEQPVFILTSVPDIPPSANLFFEFKHFKPKKDKTSTRCWSMMSHEEYTQEGPKQLEIYAKPTDYTSRTFHKHSVKPLFLNVTVSILSQDAYC
eukprot:Rhum_TRINITY_DN14870_c21_g1::Rhum_TRINITY_DN14870_c21_g1_i1::g.126329::m.126329